MPSIIFGDNHLFGINHLSFKKADEYRAKYSDENELKNFFLTLKEFKIQEQMMSSHTAVPKVIDLALMSHSELVVHPVIPYAHAINDRAASHGVARTAAELLRPSILDTALTILKFISPRSSVKTPYSSVRRFVRSQLEVFSSLPNSNKGTLLINNVFCDLLIGLGLYEWFEYLPKICSELGYSAGVITYNPKFFLHRRFAGLTICMNYNHVGYLCGLSSEELGDICGEYNVWAMGVFGSGAYTLDNVVKDLKRRNFEKVVFASSKEARILEFSNAMS